MKTFFTHIFAVLFLLIVAGSRLVGISQDTPANYTVEKVVPAHTHSLKIVEHRVAKSYQADSGFTTIEADSGDIDFSDTFVVLATLAKIIVFAFIVTSLGNKLGKRRLFYEAFVRIFSHKYIVLRTLRI